MIINFNVFTFLFGSGSNFDYLCHLAVTELREKYPEIKRVCYTCKHESCYFENEKDKWEKILSNLYKKEIKVLCVEEEFNHKTKYTAGKASYIERNQAMIDDSDFCIFFYNENYEPKKRKYYASSIGYYTPNSGTAIAYTYAKRKKKNIINIFDLQNKDK